MGGGGEVPSLLSTCCKEEHQEPISDFTFQDDPCHQSSIDDETPSDDLVVKGGVDDGLTVDKFEGRHGLGYSDYLDMEIQSRRRNKAYKEITQSYNSLQMRSSECLKQEKDRIISYRPGAWVDEAVGLKRSDYDVPKTTTLILVGPRGSGKSSLVNRILRAFETDKFRPEKAQVSYSSVADGTYYLQEYMIPSCSTSFSLYDTRSLSENACDDYEMLKNWMTKGVRHRQLVIRDSDTSMVRTSMKSKTRHAKLGEIRMVNFVIFVVSGLSVLKSMDGRDSKQYVDMLAKAFSCPYLSFRDDKPLVVVTHGDLLSQSDRVRIRIHLGELLGIPPLTQIFDIPENYEQSTELEIANMLRYSLEHADRNLPPKQRSLSKVLRSFPMLTVFVCLLTILGLIHRIDPHANRQLQHSTLEDHLNWHKIRHLW